MNKLTARRWTMDDLMDFEYFLYRDERSPERNRERALYLREIKPVLDMEPDRGTDRSFVFHLWLEARRAEEQGKRQRLTPGMVFRQIRGFVTFLCAIAGFFTGTGLCFSFLAYQGREPLNVASYLGIFILSQIFLLATGMSIIIFRKFTKQVPPFSLIRFLLWTLMMKLMETVGRKTSSSINRKTLDRFKAAWGVARGRSRCYGNLFPFPLFIPPQVFTLFFNLGLLVATLLKVLGSDLAFGWQSTLQLGSDAIYTMVRVVALPWSLFLNEPLAHPTLSQIEGTRMILKDGITRLATQDLVSWWPFLCLCVVFYGLLPRLVLLISAMLLERKAIARLRFDNMACDMLMMRLTLPLVETQGETGLPFEKDLDENLRLSATHKQHPLPGVETPGYAFRPSLVLIPRDIDKECPGQELNRHLTALYGAGFETRLAVDGDFRSDEEILAKHISPDTDRHVVCLMEAWQPPIRETLAFIGKLRELGGPTLRIHILLIGKPSDKTLFTPPSFDDVLAWKHAVEKLADINTRLDMIHGSPPVNQEETR